MRRMRREGKIQFFTKTRKFSYADVIKGIDFYLVVRTPTQLQTFTVDVTGPTGTGNRPQQVSKLAVDLRLPRSELEANIEAQILDMIHPRTLS